MIEDVLDLISRSTVENRRHATEMASLILRGDLLSDRSTVADTRILSIPVLIDTEEGSTSQDDRLFVDVIHTVLQHAYGGENPLAPDAFVVNFSIGVHGAHFAGRITALARLLDWWAREAGILFVISSGNVLDDILIPNMSMSEFESAALAEQQTLIRIAQRDQRYARTLLAPAETLNGLTVSAVSMDLSPPDFAAHHGTVAFHNDESIVPAIYSAVGLGPFRSIKPDIVAPGGQYEIRSEPMGDRLRLRIVRESRRTGLSVATSRSGASAIARSRGTSCATALVTRFVLNAAATLTGEGGPYEGVELSREQLALLTRALVVNASRWSETADAMYDSEMQSNGSKFRLAGEEVARYFGYGLIEPMHMLEGPLNGATLVGLGSVKKDEARIFDMPLPHSMAGDRIHRSMLVTISWFSPVKPSRAKYRLAALEAISADEGESEDKFWRIDMKSRPPHVDLLKRGTVWSRRFVHRRVSVPNYGENATLPIRVQCKDSSGGGLDQDDAIRFAIAVTLQIEQPVSYDIYEEIRNQLQVRLRGVQA